MMASYEREDENLKTMTTTSVQRSRRWAFTVANVDAKDKYQLSNAMLYLGPIERDSLEVSHRHGVAFGKVLESGREASIAKLSLLKKMEAVGLKVTYLASIKNMANYINYAYKNGEIPEKLKPIARNSVKTKGSNYFQDLAKELAAEFTDRPSANMFKQRILE